MRSIVEDDLAAGPEASGEELRNLVSLLDQQLCTYVMMFAVVVRVGCTILQKQATSF
jgi:hypothetical protein